MNKIIWTPVFLHHQNFYLIWILTDVMHIIENILFLLLWLHYVSNLLFNFFTHLTRLEHMH